MEDSMSKKPVIGWQFGGHKWAFRNIANHMKKALPELQHKDNEPADINVIFAADQFKHIKSDGKTIFHLDGNRWYEN